MKFYPEKVSITKKDSFRLSGEYEWFVSRESSLMRCEIYNHWLVNHGVKSIIYLPKGQVYEYYHEQKSWQKFLRVYAKQLVKNCSGHLNRYPQARRKLIDSAKKLSAAAQAGDRKNVLKAYRHYIQSAYEFCEYIWSPWAVINVLEPDFLPKLLVLLKSSSITSLDQPIEYFKMQADLFKYSLPQVVAKYSWLNVYIPRDNPYTGKDFLKIKRNLNYKELVKQEKSFSQVKREFKKLLATLPEHLTNPAKLIHEHTFLKTDRIDAWKQSMYYLRDLCKYLSKISGLPLADVGFLSMSEIISLLNGKENINQRQLGLRGKNKVLYILQKEKDLEISNQKLIRKIQNRLLEQVNGAKEVPGIPASAGIARGRVKIVLHSGDAKYVKKGEVMVASYTFPSFVPFMKIACAIVTDEGGLTSHAAIVSRELKTPCIIGTKIATKVFKDGDLVEVDANKGVVRKI